jgi:hypothetical protein
MEVANISIELAVASYNISCISLLYVKDIAKAAKVGWNYAAKVILKR